MSLKGLIEVTKTYFGGAWTAQDPVSVDLRGATLAQNVRYFDKQVQTRYGWGVAFSLTGETGNNNSFSAFNWLSEIGNYLVWYNNGDVSLRGLRLFKVSDNPPVATRVATISVTQVFGATYARTGPRLYAAFWGLSATNDVQTVVGANAVVVSKSGGSFNADAIFPGPGSTTLVPSTAPTEPGAGSVTAGLHNIGLRMQHRSGFLGRPSPDSSTSANPTPATFAPIKFTSTGGKNLNWTFTPGANWPVDVVSVQLIMSPVNSPNQYFLIPGAVQAVTGGAATVVNISFDISDDALVAGAATVECTDALSFYTASATGQAVIPVSAVAHIGNRMFYVSSLNDNNGNAYSVVFASDPFQYQQISLSQHLIQLPDLLKITQVIGVQGGIYLIGPHWTYATQDNGQTPVNWPSPQIVDGRKGALYPNCVEVNSQGKYAWIGDKTGLYLFDGAYADLPISWLNRDIWDQIEFPQTQMVIKDDPLRHRVVVLSILSGSGRLELMVWDYTGGINPYSARFSQQDPPTWIAGGPTPVGSIEIVQNDLFGGGSNTVKTPELWFTPGVYGTAQTGGFWREKDPARDATPYSDDSDTRRAITPVYQTEVLPNIGGSSSILAHQAVFPRISGNGTMSLWKVYSIDQAQSKSLGSVALTAAGSRQIQRAYLKSNGFIYYIAQNVLDGFFILSDLTMFYSRFASHR